MSFSFSQLKVKTNERMHILVVLCLHSCQDALSYSSCSIMLAIALKNRQLKIEKYLFRYYLIAFQFSNFRFTRLRFLFMVMCFTYLI